MAAGAAVLLAFGAASASAQVEVPTRGGESSAAPPAVAASPTPAAPVAARAATPATVAVRLRIGSRGAAVRDLQRELRRRGLRIAVDGSFGPGTRAAVRQIQRRLRMRVTGIADTALLRRLGLQTRVVASAPATRPAAAGTGYLAVFPVLGEYTYFDDYGAPRHQGAHQGTDIMADRGTPLVAVADAAVKRLTRTEKGLGGIYVWLERADGTEYYYAHMASIAAGITEGQRVTAGQVIGTVGNTGDARYGAPHLHFEIRLKGNRSINPYTHLVAVDPNRQGTAALRR